jgi:hypothetical protein
MSFPFGPKATVTFRPSNTNVNTSPYYKESSIEALVAYTGSGHLFTALGEEGEGISTVLNGRANDGEDVENLWR